jgi:hypothetical protein
VSAGRPVAGTNESYKETTPTSDYREDMKKGPRERDPWTANIDLLSLATQCLAQAIRSIIISIVLSLYLAYQAVTGLLVAFGGCLMFTFHVLRALPTLLIASALIPVASCALVILCTAIVWDEVQRPIVASIRQLTATMADRMQVQRNRLEERLRYIAPLPRILSISRTTSPGSDSMPPFSTTTLTSPDPSPLRSRNPPLSSFTSSNKYDYRRRRRQSVTSLKAWSPTLSPVPSISGSISGSSHASSVNISSTSSLNTTLETSLERPAMDYDHLPLAPLLQVEPLQDEHDSVEETELCHVKKVKEQFWGTTRVPAPKSDRHFISLARMKSEIGVARRYFATGGLESLVPMNLRTTAASALMPPGNEVD